MTWTIMCGLGLSCQRQTLELPDYIFAYIPITIDWSESDVPESSIANVSAYFYPTDGGEAIVTISSNKYFLLAQLPIGSYNAIIFNEIKGNIEGTTFYEGTRRSDFMVGSQTISPASYVLYEAINPEYQIDHPEAVGSWVSTNTVEITTETISYTRSSTFAKYISSIQASTSDPEKLLELLAESQSSLSAMDVQAQVLADLELIYPQPVTVTCNIQLKVINLSNAQRIETVFRGMTNLVNLSTREGYNLDKNDQPIYIFDFATKNYYDATMVDGYVESTFLTFGKQPYDETDTYELYFTAVLASGEAVRVTRDVTSQVQASDGSNIVIDLTSDEDMLILPEGVADGFGVEDWGDFENVEIH
ncbi:MAG: DUF5119 domain-containing protein [Rikenellaceae bacterium]